MKNKKLFAILTLVCFMFTLMPVAAFADDVVFYAKVQDDSKVVDTQDDILMNVYYNGAEYVDPTGQFRVVIMQDGKVYKECEFATASYDATAEGVNIGKIADPGTYDIYLVNNGAARVSAILTQYTNATITKDAAAAMLLEASDVTMLDAKTVTVKNAGGDAYKLSFVNLDNNSDLAINATDASKATLSNLAANSGFTTEEVYVKLTNGNSPVIGKEVTVKTNSSAVEVATSGVTDGAGMVKLEITGASIAGDFKVYVSYGKAKATLDVDSDALAPAVITTVVEPNAPIALNTDIDTTDVEATGIYFAVTDANGNNVLPAEGEHKITVVKPAGSKMDAKNLVLANAGDTYAIVAKTGTELFDEEGTYTFKVMLNNGAYATATVEVKDFQEPVELKLVYPTATVELNGKIAPSKIVFVDANGVTLAADVPADVELSANGYAIENFYAEAVAADEEAGTPAIKAGTVVAKANEKYVGSKITVLAVSTEYNLTAVAELAVANEAAAVKFATTNADVAVNNTFVANIVDADGNKVALNAAAAANNATIQYIVLDQPEDSKVAVSTKTKTDLAAKGQFKVSFTASKIGDYKVQTVVRYEQDGGTGEPVVKYYSGIETITVGNTGFKDIVVMSVGSNEIVKNAKTVAIDAAPIVENNRTFVPFRALAEAFGATVAFDEATQAVTAELNGTTVVMTIGSAEYTVNGVAKTADVAPFINGSRTMVPVRFAAEAFGIKVIPTYDENGATADILFNL